MGSLRERAPGIWQARVYNGLDPVSGRRRAAKTIRASSRKAAQAELRKLERQVAAGRVPRGTTARTFGEQVDRWFEAKRRRLSPATQGAYAAAVKLLDPLRQVPLGKLGAEDLDALYAKLEADGKANATIRRVHNIARAVLDQAERHELIERNPALRADPPPVRAKPTRPPTLEELTALLQNAGDEQFATFLFVAAATGARRGELASAPLERRRSRRVDTQDPGEHDSRSHPEGHQDAPAACDGPRPGHCRGARCSPRALRGLLCGGWSRALGRELCVHGSAWLRRRARSERSHPAIHPALPTPRDSWRAAARPPPLRRYATDRGRR